MSAQPTEQSAKNPVHDLLDRLKWAVSDLEEAAQSAESAASDLRDLAVPGALDTPAFSRDELALAVRDWHDGEAQHQGAFVWCAHAVCRTARGA